MTEVAVQRIGEHVEHETESNNVVWFFEKKKSHIHYHCVVGV